MNISWIIIIQSEVTRLVSAAISDCAARIGIFDCSLCALNHSALRHVNEAIHRRVTRAAPSCFGRESPWAVPARAKRVSRTFDAPLGGFSFLLSAVPSAAYPHSLLFSLASCFSRNRQFFAGKFATRATVTPENFLARAFT